ncbi:MAG: carboxyl-terminal processing protease, partial [Neolewinella sp.]
MAKSTNIWTPLLFALTLAIGLFIGYRLQSSTPLIASGSDASGGGRIEELLRFIEARYVDDANSGKLYDVAIEAVLTELDP